MKSRTGQKLKLTTVEQLLGVPNEEISTKIEIEKIYEFENHPFKVIDEKKEDLVESIRDNGVRMMKMVMRWFPVTEECMLRSGLVLLLSFLRNNPEDCFQSYTKSEEEMKNYGKNYQNF